MRREDAKYRICTRSLAALECNQAARLHLAGLSADFISRFGERFLERYYSASLQSPHADVIAAVDCSEGKVHGVLLGILDTPSHYSFLLKNYGVSLVLQAVIRSIADPGLGWDLLKSRGTRYARGVARTLGGRRSRRDEAVHSEKVGLLAHLVVEEDFRGVGIGRMLLDSYERRAREFGLDRLELVTHTGDLGAGPFYSRLGWEHRGRKTSRSGESFEFYIKQING
ncbi:GNAT family N-acetyltransferase [Rubrobacter radiotolerans]|uniref:GNAT family N-acetyltransferase n=1 Tax=Rubrobacter radiotolerans TaxID=42256 RepID=A0AB35T5I9_RUBRA|nr:GNAT family N-acetyltransferase [Rubrobacter radiotolerans]MDX5895149.1 GNAT family N-acetyltransferase [Rubrobacter radiotolerans]SMC07544.1 Acetyltransferase (GNAT) family protein [Rubrobacter radiotolerans DSM 5868]